MNSMWYDDQDVRDKRSSTAALLQKVQNLKRLDATTAESRDLAARHWTEETLLKYIDETKSVIEKQNFGSLSEKTRSFFRTFSVFATRVCNILKTVLPSTPEYQGILAAVALLLFAFNTRSEIEAKIIEQIASFNEILPTIDFLKSAVANARLEEAIGGIRVEIANYLFDAVVYLKKPRIRQLVSALVKDPNTIFEDRVLAIKSYRATILNLQSTTNLAVGIDTKDELGNVSQNTRLILKVLAESQATMSILSSQISSCQESLKSQAAFTAKFHATALHQALVPESYPYTKIVARIESNQQNLMPKERWEHQEIAPSVKAWLTYSQHRRPFLFVSGPHRKTLQTSWLSPFSVDLASAISTDSNASIAYVFCDTLPSEAQLTPDMIIRLLICQILLSNPELATDYYDRFNPARVQSFQTPQGPNVWASLALLREMIDCLRFSTAWPPHGYFLVLDRIDCLPSTRACSLGKDFLPALQRLSSTFDDVNVIVTSAVPASSFLPGLKTTEEELYNVAVEAPRAVSMHAV